MGSKWAEGTVGDFFDLVTGYAFKSEDFTDSGVPVIKIKNVKAGQFSEHEFSYVNEDFLPERSDKLARPNDLLISMSGNRHDGTPETWVGKIALFNSPGNYLINQRVGALRLKDRAPLNTRFASYLLSSRPYQNLFIAIATSSGGQANLSPKQIADAPLRYPDIDTQRKISAILGSLDDKIALNQKMNETVEAMAQAIFKSWFVDFDPVRAKAEGRDPGLPKHIADLFPSSFEDSELGEIPKGWKVANLGDLLELSYGKALKEENRRPGSVDVFGSNGRVGSHDEKISSGPGIIVGRKGNPGIVTWAPSDFFVIDTAFYVIPKSTCSSLYFLYYALKSHDLASLGADSAVPGLNRNMAYMSTQIVPTAELLRAFDSKIEPFFQRIHQNNTESNTLGLIRDALLPKLISGEIKVNGAVN